MSAAAPALTAIEQEAIGWEAQLRGGAVQADELLAFDAWLARSAAHQAAWDGLQQRLARWSGAGTAAATALRTEGADRRRLLRAGFHLAVLGLAGLGARQVWHETGADADLASATGQRRSVTLADGSAALLDAGSRVYQRGQRGQPVLELRQGQMVLQVAPRRPLDISVAVGDSLLSTRGAVFNVGRFTQRNVVALERGQATLHRPGRAPLLLGAGETVYWSGQRLEHSTQSYATVTAWRRGLFVADRLPLEQLVSVLNRYQSGVVRASGTAAQLPISGVFRLDDVAQILLQLADILPLKVRRYGPWLTVLS